MELLDEELDKNIIHGQADHHQEEIPEELYPPEQDRIREDNIFVQQISHRKTDAERHQKGKNIGGNRDNPEVDESFVENVVVADKIQEDIQQGIRASAGRVAEGLNGHQLAEWGVKEIDEIETRGRHCTPNSPTRLYSAVAERGDHWFSDTGRHNRRTMRMGRS